MSKSLAERCRAERASQGLPEHVEDEAVLEWIAALLSEEAGDRADVA
jgi:hypothetical protein